MRFLYVACRSEKKTNILNSKTKILLFEYVTESPESSVENIRNLSAQEIIN